MSGSTTKHFISAYLQMAQPMMFLTGFFQSPAENFHNSEEVEIDIVRSDEDVAIVVQDLSTGYRMNTEDLYTNKSFKPPVYKEAVPINSHDLIKRMPGENPFKSPNFRGNVILRFFKAITKVERKIRRALEVQASQVLQTGTITLTDETGAPLYTIDYKPKATHFPTAGTTWGTAGADIYGDLQALSTVIRNDGLTNPNQLLMGEKAFEALIQDPQSQERFDNRRINTGALGMMEVRGDGGQFRGVIEVGNYKFDVYTYGAKFKDPVTGLKRDYIDTGKVVMRATGGRMDATFGSIPNIGNLIGHQNAAKALLPELPGRMKNQKGSMDLFTNAWLSNDGAQLFGGVGARPLLIPTAIDTYGCLDTGIV
jgi:hypothetical protein